MPLVETLGVTLCYETAGDPAGPALLLIHGHGAQLVAWHDGLVADLVERGFFTIRYDHRDAGLSTHLVDAPAPDLGAIFWGDTTTMPYAIEDLADDAAGLLDALAIDAAHVLGVSMGGMVAQSLAIRHPSKTRSLTSVMSTPDPLRVGTPTDEVAATMLEPGPTDRDGVVEQALQSWRRTGSPALGIDEEWVAETTALAYDRCFDPDGVTRQFAAILGSPDRRPGLGGVAVPTLVVHGAIDPIVTLPGGEATAAAVAGSRLLVIDQMGHDLPRVVWPEVLDAVCEVTGVAAAAR
jgi:pimeloyl-ACP methyl ester carboxylesterase